MSDDLRHIKGEVRIIDKQFLVIQNNHTIKANILGRDTCPDGKTERIYLDCRIHDHNETSVGEYAISGVISSILTKTLASLDS